MAQSSAARQFLLGVLKFPGKVIKKGLDRIENNWRQEAKARNTKPAKGPYDRF